MSARVCIQQCQGLTLCPRGESHHARKLQTPSRSLFLHQARKFTCRGLTVNKLKLRLHNTRASKWCAEYTDSGDRPQGVRSNDLGFSAVHGEENVQSSAVDGSIDEHNYVNGIAVVSSGIHLNGHANSHVLEETSSLEEHNHNKTRHNEDSAGVSLPVFHVIGGDGVAHNGFLENGRILKDDTTEKSDETPTGASNSQAGLDDPEFYVPVIGHLVVGVVVSGNHAKLDVDIGAAKLGQLHVQELLPLDHFQIERNKWMLADDASDGGSTGSPPGGHPLVVYDEEVFTYEVPTAPLVVDTGTVLEMEVVGKTMSGRALLSSRKAAQRVEWDRIMQIKEENEPFEVEITGYNKLGVIARVEGLRAFLPEAELVKQPDVSKGESHESCVGRTLWVSIAFAREIRGNIILSEKNAWIKRNLQVGSLHDGTVVQLFPYGALVKVTETDTVWGMIHISNIASARINKVSDIFEIGEQIKMIAVKCPIPDKFSFSTALLESEPGLMLRDKQRVFGEAEERAIALQKEHSEWKQPTSEDGAEAGAEKASGWKSSKTISNLEWLDFIKEEKPLS